MVLSTLVAESTSGITLISGLTGVASMLVMGWTVNLSFVYPGGGNTLNVPLALCYLLAPLMGGLAALRVGRLAAQGALDLAATTPRGRGSAVAVVGVAYLLWSLVAYACGVAVVGLNIGVAGPWTAGMALLAVDAVLLLAMFISLGLAIGSRVSNVLIGPVVTVVGLVTLNALDLSPDPIGRFSPIFPGDVYTYGVQPNNARLVGIVVVLLAVTAGLAALGFYLRGVRRVVTGVLGVMLALAGVVQVLSSPPGALAVRSGSTGECRNLDDVELCLWPGPGVEVNTALTALVRIRTITAAFVPVPRRFQEEGLENGPGFTSIDVAPPGADPSYVATARDAVIPQSCNDTTYRDRLELYGLLNETMRPGSVGQEQPQATGAALANRPVAEQRVWARPRWEALRACD